MTTYSADISYTALSVNGINSLLSDGHDEIQKKHVAAEEIQERLESSSFIDTLQKLKKIDTTVTQFFQFKTSMIERTETSLIYRIDEALKFAIDMANKDVSGLFVNITDYNTYYRDNLAFQREWLDDMLHRGGSLLSGVMRPHINNIPASLKWLEEMSALLDSVLSFGEHYGSIAKFGMAARRKHPFCPINALSESYISDSNVCLNYLTLLTAYSSAISDIKDRMSNDSTYIVSDAYLFEHFGIKQSDVFQDWKVMQRDVCHCLNEYGVYLTRVQDWLLDPLTYTPRYILKSTLQI